MPKMVKKIVSLVLSVVLCFGVTAVATDISAETVAVDAADYYASITATSGTALLGQVHDLITTTHKKYTSYNDCKNPTYVKKTDPGSNDTSVMEFYSQADISATWGSGAVGTWNREHVWCQSLSNGMWGQTGAGADLHHIRPVETRLNSTRNNNLYGVVSNRDSYKVYYKDQNGANVAHGGYNSGGTFEPLDNVKGDVARIVLYVYTHYNTYKNVSGSTNGGGNGGYFGTLTFTKIISERSESAAISLLLQWNAADPVDTVEQTRNDAVYAIQGNRNPFIDHPEYAEAIWGGGTVTPDPVEELKGLSLNMTSLTLEEGESATLTVTPDPVTASASVAWTSSNPAVATVSESGVVTAKSAGIATVTATSTVDPSVKTTAEVTVEKSEGTGETGETGESAKLLAFRTAVANIRSDGKLNDRFASINRAIAAYRALSDAEKAQAEEDEIALLKAIEEYNALVNSYNENAQQANEGALKGRGA